MNSDREALFAAVLADPDDDTVRLAYADALEEAAQANPVRVMCRACEKPPDRVNHVPGHIFVGWGHGWRPCSVCGGCETVLDTADADLAELVRVECELAPLRSSLKFDSRKDPLYTRARELLAAHPEWLRDLTMPCPGCEGVPHFRQTRLGAAPTCKTCRGTLDLLRQYSSEDPSGMPLERRTVTLTRGLTLAVECRLDEVVREVRVNHGTPTHHEYFGTWQPTPWALAFREACVGLGRVPWWRVTDRGPKRNNDRDGWHWVNGAVNDPDPAGISCLKLLPGLWDDSRPIGSRPTLYPTPEAARGALEMAVYRFVQGTPTNT